MSLYSNYVLALLAILSIILGVFVLTIEIPLVTGSTPLDPISDVYGFKINLTRIGITPSYVSVIDSSRILIVGSYMGVSVVTVLRVLDPYSDPIIEDVYPLTGSPTSIATNGYPVSRIAVGSDKGEVLLLSVDKGRITRHLYTVLGADFYVNSLFLAKSKVGDVKIIALVSEGGPRTYPCLNCYVYILSEDGRGLLRIGPRTGNATTTCPGLDEVNVQHIAPLGVHSAEGYYWDASTVLLAYIQPLIKLVFNVIYLNTTTGEETPLPGVLVEVSLTYLETNATLIYGVNADTEGVVRVPIPYEKNYTLIVNLTIRDITGNPIWRYTYKFSPALFPERPEEIPLPTVFLVTPNVDKRSASRIYKMPPFLSTLLNIIDISNAPLTCVRRSVVDFTVKPSVKDLTLIRGSVDIYSKFLYVDPDTGFLDIVVFPTTDSKITPRSLIRDYVGYAVSLVSASTYSNGSYIIVGLSDGRLRIYEFSGSYQLRYIYSMGSKLLSLITIPHIEGYVYVAISASGIQVFRVDPYTVPVFRNLTYLYLTTPGYIHGNVLADLTTIVLAQRDSLIVVRNTDIAVKNGLILTLEDLIGRDIELVVSTPGGENIAGSLLVFKYIGGSTTSTLIDNRILLHNIIPGVEYTVELYPALNYIHSCSLTFILRKDRVLVVLSIKNANYTVEQVPYKITLNTSYVAYNVKLKITDKLSGKTLIAPLNILVDDIPIVTESLKNEHEFKLLYGVHKLTIKPSRGFENAYYEYTTELLIRESLEISVELNRVEYSVSISIIDEYGDLISPVQVMLEGPVGASIPTVLTAIIETPATPLLARVPYGEYTLTINPLNTAIYVPWTTKLNITSSQNIVVSLQRVKYNVTVRFTSTLPIICNYDLYANDTIVMSNVGVNEVVVQLPYGVNTLSAIPRRESERACLPSKLITIKVESNTNVTIPIERRVYKLRIIALEGETPISSVGIRVFSVELGAIFTTDLTDVNGVAVLSLPYGFYRIVLEHPKYTTSEFFITVDQDKSEIVSLRPSIQTLLWRFMPVIAILLAILAVIIVIRKIRSILIKRLPTEETYY